VSAPTALGQAFSNHGPGGPGRPAPGTPPGFQKLLT